MACPGSSRMEAGLPDSTSVYAEEGTAAHELAAHCFTQNVDAASCIGQIFNGFTVDAEMARHVQAYIDYCTDVEE